MPVEYDEGLLQELREMFRNLESEVTIYFFVDPNAECAYCGDTEQILELIRTASDGKVKVVKLSKDSEEAKRYNIDMFPAILIHGKDEWNIRYFGIPAGYEFGAFVEDIIDASKGEPKISPQLKEILTKYVTKPTRIMVFVTPTCPYCPLAVRAVHRFAMVNKNIYGDMVEALEFQELADKYAVFAVPKIIIQVDGEDKLEFEGAAPDPYFVAKILEAYGIEPPKELQEELMGINEASETHIEEHEHEHYH